MSASGFLDRMRREEEVQLPDHPPQDSSTELPEPSRVPDPSRDQRTSSITSLAGFWDRVTHKRWEDEVHTALSQAMQAFQTHFEASLTVSADRAMRQSMAKAEAVLQERFGNYNMTSWNVVSSVDKVDRRGQTLSDVIAVTYMPDFDSQVGSIDDDPYGILRASSSSYIIDGSFGSLWIDADDIFNGLVTSVVQRTLSMNIDGVHASGFTPIRMLYDTLIKNFHMGAVLYRDGDSHIVRTIYVDSNSLASAQEDLAALHCFSWHGQPCENSWIPSLMSQALASLDAVCDSTLWLAMSLEDNRVRYGFYLHVYGDPAAVIYQVREVKKFFPRSPIYVMSDGGLDFSALCEKEGCTFVLCPPANDRWHPWPFFRRLYDAAVSLNTKYIIMLEPDNTVHSYVKRPPPADVGGLLVTSRQFGLVKYVERMAKQRVPNFKWTSRSMSSGLCGGAYFKREAILDALSDESMMKLDWNYLGEKLSKEIFSSDFALQYAFAARGWVIEPWEDAAQMDKDKYQPLTGARDATFKHYCSCYPGGKPTYNLKLAKQDAKLFKSGGYEMTSGPYSSSVCQVCYNHSRYLELWGSARCTNSIPFHLSEKLLQRPGAPTAVGDLWEGEVATSATSPGWGYLNFNH
ncbi:unnamed protein product [Durusdinium trenchii]|uniref:Uncharacterized protein n=1 Tax=Durusdinium trenchii TaxID=1381693 RepID=A0ABP0H7J4_9DINO